LLDVKTKAFTDQYVEYYPLIYNIVYSKIKSPESVEDICQEIFTRFFLKFDEVENPRRWLLAAMRNVLYEFYRKNSESHVDIDSVMDDVKVSFVNGFRDTRIMIDEALDDMKFYVEEKNRLIFELIAVNNYTYKEAAVSLGMTEHQTRYRYNAVVGRLMDHFRKKGIHGLEDIL
jgi:RNA polymerase sigma factor (sigma-70 family)